jgi:hypothetical protein
MRPPPRLAALGLALLATGAARADEDKDETSRRFERLIERPHGIAVVHGGVLALPNAPISSSTSGGDVPVLGPIGSGDATITIGGTVLFRGGPSWSIGAGFMFAPKPTSDDQYGGLSGLKRTHARSYLCVGGEARYIPLRTRWIEGWVGMNGGVVIVADRFYTDVPITIPVLGGKGVTLSSEGVALGLQLGVDWLITDKLVAGLGLRGQHWILPTDTRCSALGDCTTLQGNTVAFEGTLSFGYRIFL